MTTRSTARSTTRNATRNATGSPRIFCFSVLLLVLSAIPAWAATPATSTAAAAGANVRVVRLSLAQGDVEVDRNISGNQAGNQAEGWEQAINNMPLTAGTRLYAADGSKAEIEFEDGSSIRLAGPAQLSLKKLSFAPDGAPLNEIEVDSGLIYVNARLDDHANFRLQDFNGESFAVTQPSRLRFKVDEQVGSLAVMDGEAEALNDSGKAKIRAGETYNYILGQPESAVRQAAVRPESEDTWDHQRDQYDDQYAAAGAQYSGSDNPGAYGDADLGHYGSYEDIPGYGESWQPAGVGPDWSPFDNGAWSYYPDWGWTFVSAYPWGWAPFYFGNWCYVSGRGWWWHPGPGHGHGGPHGPGAPHGGGHNAGFHPQPLLTSTPHGFSAPHPPSGSAHQTVAVAGSNLRVGPIGITHATSTQASLTGATMSDGKFTHAGMAVSGPPSASAGRTMQQTGARSTLVHSAPASNRPSSLIGGQRGSYYVTHPTPGRTANYPASMSRAADSGSTPRSYSDTETPRAYAPRTYSAPPAPIERAPAPPPASSQPHISFSGSAGGFQVGSSGGVGAVHSGGSGFSGGGGVHAGGHR